MMWYDIVWKEFIKDFTKLIILSIFLVFIKRIRRVIDKNNQRVAVVTTHSGIQTSHGSISPSPRSNLENKIVMIVRNENENDSFKILCTKYLNGTYIENKRMKVCIIENDKYRF